jgi:hypothetical protein
MEHEEASESRWRASRTYITARQART